MILKKDNYIFGFALGLIAPIFGFIIFKYTRFQGIPFMEVLTAVIQQHALLSAALSVSLLANAVIFTYYINKHIDKTAKGIFLATGIYGIAILILKTFY
ncbi:MAG TPA: hypothetical protein VK718_12095 [Ferruginibacter sp.]|jgi:hypothetical protein|nr:hypothetical protein [Ferruginibacter sp.]